MSNTTTSAGLPTSSVPRSVMPKISAGRWVSMWMPSSRLNASRPRMNDDRNSVEYLASHSWLAWAPASDRPITVLGSLSSTWMSS